MSNIIINGRHFVASSGTGESTDPYVLTVNQYLDSTLFTVTFVMDTSALADGDLASNPIEIPNKCCS